MALISKDKLDWASTFVLNKYGITEKDMIGDLKGFPVGVVVWMLEEQEKQGNKPDVTVFQRCKNAREKLCGFIWYKTQEESLFWEHVIFYLNFKVFFDKYPEYKKYDFKID